MDAVSHVEQAVGGFDRIDMNREPFRSLPEPHRSYLIGGINHCRAALRLLGMSVASQGFRHSLEGAGIHTSYKATCPKCHLTSHWMLRPSDCPHCGAELTEKRGSYEPSK